MKKRITRVLSLVLAAVTLMATCAMAANAAETYPTVRVNGVTVEYPDAQPYVDENDRTMIPVRFVTEELGADVKWDGKTRTASISKNGIKVDITIGSPDLKVTQNGKTETVKMDTAAVLKDGRTYVPIRYVAEALGAYVDYADAFKVVGIYLDKLSADEISELREYGYTTPDGGFTYEEYKAKNGAKQAEFYYGTYRDTFGNFANSHEYLYHRFTPSTIKYTCDEIGETLVANNAVKFYETTRMPSITTLSLWGWMLTAFPGTLTSAAPIATVRRSASMWRAAIQSKAFIISGQMGASSCLRLPLICCRTSPFTQSTGRSPAMCPVAELRLCLYWRWSNEWIGSIPSISATTTTRQGTLPASVWRSFYLSGGLTQNAFSQSRKTGMQI